MTRSSAYILTICVLLLAAFGLVMQMSTGAYTLEGQEDSLAGLKKQSVWFGLGLIGCGVMALIDYRIWRRLAWPVFWGTVILLVLCFIPGIGQEINHAHRWIGFRIPGVGGLSGQPSELAKIGTLMALSGWCANHRDQRKTFLKGFLYPLLLVGIPIGLIAAEVDLGTASLLFGGCTAVLFLAGARTLYVGGMVLIGVAALGLAIAFIPNRLARVTAFQYLEDPEWNRAHPDMAEMNRQQKQGIIALGSGGVEGLGLGDSRQKQYYLPLPHTDFVFAVVGEELGLVATLGVIALFLTVGLTGTLIAMHAPDRFGKLLGSGITLLIVGQAIINIGVTTGCLPNKGMPLPFISYGGSSLFGCLLAVGILLNIFRHGRDLAPGSDPVLQRQKLTPAM